ncbi:MAG: hypothetical protein OdinLCB4_001195 [Candidatus Odinarchaeum yellowstonii]|uniref:Major facilitator superfamily (MFS) profile domain-containing protein n=1 Tax=Odinarchaeota yellowstonii (strain LCB_4) TaxID=1841599 RepID=A0AAF0D2Q4_ODILC|nr:MAG: hypothetical protein OdinLCB4_001195 [Candidatus Odinarchaeum yellowstonii]
MDTLNRLYLTEIFRSISHSAIGIFLPIYLLKTGLNLSELSLFFIIMFAFNILSAALSLLFLMNKGPILMALSLLVRGFFYYSLFAYLDWHIIALVFGLAIGLYWSVMDLAIIYFPKSNRGFKIGMLYSLMNTASMLGPIIGGFVITYIGYGGLFIVSILLVIPAILSALLIGDINWDFKKIDFSVLKNYLNNKKGLIILFFTLVYGMTSVPGWIYQPILLNQLAGTELNMGVIQTVVNILVSLSYIIAGRFFDRNRARVLLILALIIEGTSMIIIGFSTSIELFTVGSWLSSLGIALLAAPFWGVLSKSVSKEKFNVLIFFTSIALGGVRMISIALLEPLLIIGNLMLIFNIIGVIIFLGLIAAYLLPKELFNNKS